MLLFLLLYRLLCSWVRLTVMLLVWLCHEWNRYYLKYESLVTNGFPGLHYIYPSIIVTVKYFFMNYYEHKRIYEVARGVCASLDLGFIEWSNIFSITYINNSCKTIWKLAFSPLLILLAFHIYYTFYKKPKKRVCQ